MTFKNITIEKTNNNIYLVKSNDSVIWNLTDIYDSYVDLYFYLNFNSYLFTLQDSINIFDYIKQ